MFAFNEYSKLLLILCPLFSSANIVKLTGQSTSFGQTPRYDSLRRDSVAAPVFRQRQVDYYLNKHRVFGAHIGLDFSKALHSSEDDISSAGAGFTASIYYQHGLRLFGGRSELNYSRQGFLYKSAGENGRVKNDYLSLLTLSTLTIVHRAQLQFGTRQGFLLSSVDSKGEATGQVSVLNSFNRFDFGLIAGVEAYPYDGFLVGLRYNFGLTRLEQKSSTGLSSQFPFSLLNNPNRLKNGAFEVFIGYQLPF